MVDPSRHLPSIIAVADRIRHRRAELLHESVDVCWDDLPVDERVVFYELALDAIGTWINEVHAVHHRSALVCA